MITTVGFLARFVAFAALLCAVGAIAFRLLILNRAVLLPAGSVVRGSRRAASIGVVCGALIVASALVKLVVQTDEMRFPTDSWITVGGNLLLATTWGKTWLIQVGSALLLTMTMTLGRKDALPHWRMVALLALVMAGTFSYSSHAMSAARLGQYTLYADVLHLVGASMWLGTLAVMFISVVAGDGTDPASELAPVALRLQYLSGLLRVFSPVALVGAATVGASGVLAAFAHFTHVRELTTTRYGVYLLIKLGLVALVALMGFRNWRVLTPSLRRDVGNTDTSHTDTSQSVTSHTVPSHTDMSQRVKSHTTRSSKAPTRSMIRTMLLEVLLAVAVLGVTAALVVTPPPSELMSTP